MSTESESTRATTAPASALKTLQDRAIKAEMEAGEEMFLGLPDKWYEARPEYGCENGHVSTRYLKCEDHGALCLACQKPIAMIPQGYTDETLAVALAAIRAEDAGGEPATGSAGLRAALEGYVAFAKTRRDELGYLSPEMEIVDMQARNALAAREPAPVACKWPTCQSEAYQDELAKEIHRQLYSGEPAPVARELDVEAEQYTLDQIAAACAECDVPDAHFESIALELRSAQATAESAPASKPPP